MSLSLVAVMALSLCGQAKGPARITGFTYSCPAPFLSARWADKSGHMLADGKVGRDVAVIYQQAGRLDISVSLPRPCRVDHVLLHLHRYNDNYKCEQVALDAQVGGLWTETDHKPGFLAAFDPQHANFDIDLAGKGVQTDRLRLVFDTGGILAISEIEVYGTPAPAAPVAAGANLAPVDHASVREADVDGDGKLDLVLENRWVRAVISPARGGVVRSLIYKPTGAELACAQDSNFGLLRQQLWKPSYFFANDPCTATHGEGRGAAWVELRTTGAGGMMSFTHTRLRLTLTDRSPALAVEWQIRNDPSSMTTYEYGPWIHNWAGTPGGVTRYFTPTTGGVQELDFTPGKPVAQSDVWYRDPARGWTALVSEPTRAGGRATGLAFVVPYRDLACFYHWLSPSSPAATVEWRHGLVTLKAGEAFTARYVLMPFVCRSGVAAGKGAPGLDRVDGVCLAAPLTSGATAGRSDAAVAGSPPVLGAIDAHPAAGKVRAQVKVLSPPGAEKAEAVARWRVYPGGEWRELGRKALLPNAVTEVFDGVVPAPAGQATVVSCQLLVAGKPADDFERFLDFAGTRVAYRLEPREKREARVESQPTGALPRHDLQRTVVTPHVAWARPYARGPIRALVLCDDENAREVIELAERLDLDFTYVKFRTTRDTDYTWEGDRSLPDLRAAQKRLLADLDKPFDVAVIAGFDWQVHFTPEIRAKLAAKVEAGMGLVAIEPCGVQADDPLAGALGLSADNRPLGAFYTWQSTRKDYITRALWWRWDDQADYPGLMPRTRRMEYKRWPEGKVLATYKEDGKPLLTTERVGKGRVVTATYDVLTHDMSYRGFSALTPIISYRGALLLPEYREMTWPYAETWWALLTRMVVYAARREASARIADLAATIDGRGHVEVRLKAAVGDGEAGAGRGTGDAGGAAARGLLVATLQLTDRYGTAITAGTGEAEAGSVAAPALLAPGAQLVSQGTGDLLAFGSRDVRVTPGQEVTVDLGPARAGWNFVRAVLRDARSRASVDWGLVPVDYARPPVAIKSLEVDRDPVTDCHLLVAPGQPWARVFAPDKPLRLTVHLSGAAPLAAGWRVGAELYDTHGRLLFAQEKPAAGVDRRTVFSFLPMELYNMGLQWRVAVLRRTSRSRAGATQVQVVDTARRRLIALPPRVWDRLSFTSWSPDYLTRCYWLQDYLMPIVGGVGVDVGMDSISELLSGKVYADKWYNIRHSYIGLLDYPGAGIPSFRDKSFAQKAAKYSQTKDKSLLVRQPCLNDPTYRAALATALPQRIAEAGKAGFSYDYCMGDEWSLTSYTSYFDYCFSPHCLSAFRRWLQKRYRSLDALNAAWDTHFTSWDAVMPMTLDEVRGRANAAPWAEFRTFMNDTVAGFFTFVQHTIRTVDPQAKCGLSGTQEPKPGNGMDWWKLSKAFSYYHSYNTGWSDEMRRSFAADTGVMQSPYRAGYWQSGRGLEQNFYWCLLHDTQGISCWTTPLLVYSDFTLTQAGRDTQRLLHELRGGLWDLVRDAKRQNDGIAIHYSQASINAALLMDQDQHIVATRDAWVKLIHGLGLQSDFLATEQIEAGELTRRPGRYRVLILPESIALSDKEAAAIRKFVAAGGTVIADGWCGLMDDRCRRRARPALDDLFGVRRGSATAPQTASARQASERVAVSAQLTGKPIDLRLRPAEADLRAAGAQAFAHSGGVPVMLQAKAGKGQAWYLNLDLSSWPRDVDAHTPNDGAVMAAIGAVLKRAGVEPAVRVRYASGRPCHIEVVRYRLGRATIVGLLGGDASDKAVVGLGRALDIYDLRAHAYLGRRAELTLPLASACRMLLLTDEKLSGPRLELAARRAKPGDAVKCTLALAGRSDAPQMVRLDVLAPGGRPVADYARNILLSGKAVPVSFVTALNDPPGRWQVRVMDLASGQTATASFELAGEANSARPAAG